MINKPLVILAGGFGTRLKSVLNGLPKPMADINGTPFLFYLFQNWINKGFNDFILSLHFESEVIIDFIENQKKSLLKDCNVRYVVEPTPLGTGGAISYLIKKTNLDDIFFVANADTWIEDGYSVLNEIEGNVIGVVEIDDTQRYGSVLIDNDGFILKFTEKNNPKYNGLINGGIYKLLKDEFKNCNENPYPIKNDFFQKLISKKKLQAQKINTQFIDIGVPEDYYRFCKLKQF